MKLIDDWRKIALHAWSIRLNLLGALFVGMEGVIQVMSAFSYLPDWMPKGVFLALSFVSNAGAFVARLTKQKAFIPPENSSLREEMKLVQNGFSKLQIVKPGDDHGANK